MGVCRTTLRKNCSRLALAAVSLVTPAVIGQDPCPPSPPGASLRAPASARAAHREPPPTGVTRTRLPASAGVALAATGTLFDPSPLTGRCGDPAGIWLGTRWRGEASWRLNLGSVPEYLRDPDLVRWQITQAATTVATGRNDCGLPQALVIRQRYEGSTARRANVTREGGCGKRDGHNVVSFGRLASGLLAVTCVWWEGEASDARSVEADILVDSAENVFFLSLPEDCHDQWDLGSILTHEFGHVFGLGHVPYHRHGALTMSDALPDCTTGYRGLGLGDYLALLDQYDLPIRQYDLPTRRHDPPMRQRDLPGRR